jgi:hypothetical protein
MHLNKRLILILGLVTLVVFPLPTFYFLIFWENLSFFEIIEKDTFKALPILYGLEFGIIYAFAATLLLKAPIFDRVPLKMEKMIRSLNLSVPEALFLSLCAGIGEELLFRSGVQFYLGIWPTSILFVAIHGYFSIRQPLISLYGLIVLPFIVVIAYGFDYFGLWFAVAAHFAYDAVLFLNIITTKDEINS